MTRGLRPFIYTLVYRLTKIHRLWNGKEKEINTIGGVYSVCKQHLEKIK